MCQHTIEERDPCNPALNRSCYNGICPDGDCFGVGADGIEYPLETAKQIKVFCRTGKFEESSRQRKTRERRESFERMRQERLDAIATAIYLLESGAATCAQSLQTDRVAHDYGTFKIFEYEPCGKPASTVSTFLSYGCKADDFRCDEHKGEDWQRHTVETLRDALKEAA